MVEFLISGTAFALANCSVALVDHSVEARTATVDLILVVPAEYGEVSPPQLKERGYDWHFEEWTEIQHHHESPTRRLLGRGVLTWNADVARPIRVGLQHLPYDVRAEIVVP